MNKPFNTRNQENFLKLLNVLENNASPTQRELSKNIDISLGKINFLLTEMVKAGYIKIQKFKNSKNKRAYFYVLTPEGMKKKKVLTQKFLENKIKEYDRLREEISQLKQLVSY